ncbi:uncharacterized protein [Glycine max]|uniref:uncharacterized protein isoform X3 n=1 Tax=Glycine max TaxID=3847 RepID=UPI0003DE8DC9|nr:uncharacterized protein LOC102670220 isoform X3 [Glycine max]|eukprot:XP_006604177.1 uncharacterized protein LOC102670220 isoform X2 [Glycine max]
MINTILLFSQILSWYHRARLQSATHFLGISSSSLSLIFFSFNLFFVFILCFSPPPPPISAVLAVMMTTPVTTGGGGGDPPPNGGHVQLIQPPSVNTNFNQIPAMFVMIADRDAGHVTEAYHAWEQRDQLLPSWLQSTISASMLCKFIGCTNSWSLWDKIHNYFHAHTNERVRQLRTDLRQISVEAQSVSDFLSAIQNIVHFLVSIGDPISVKEYIDIIIEGSK